MVPHIASARVMPPHAIIGEIERPILASNILAGTHRHVFVQAGAGYGKTTLFAQMARQLNNVVWLTLDGEGDVYTLLNMLTLAVQRVFPAFDFTLSEYIPFEERASFITILANGLISSIEALNTDLTIVLEDLHTISDDGIRQLIYCALKYSPKGTRFFLNSRDEPWLELISLRARGEILELTQRDLAFTPAETEQVLGAADEKLYALTEGWPLAVGSFRVLAQRGAELNDLPVLGREALYAYIFYECVARLSSPLVDLLATSACLTELDPLLLDAVLETQDARDRLEELVKHNLFTIKTGEGKYRYHALFQEYIGGKINDAQKASICKKAAAWYIETRDYSAAAGYAIRLNDWKLLCQVILLSYGEHIKTGHFSELRAWFHALTEAGYVEDTELLIAKGAYLSSVGNFTAANACLDRAIPQLDSGCTLYLDAMTHKARALRNCESFAASNDLLDKLITGLPNLAGECTYGIVIEKIYNLAWDSRLAEAFQLTARAMDDCATAGDARVRRWYERYLSVLHFLAGRMKNSVYYYERSLEIPEDERRLLSRHSIDIFAAKAYQMLGRREEAVQMITAELQNLKAAGLGEELWLGYLFAAEIHYQNISIDNFGDSALTYETVAKYFTLADEYAPMYRKTSAQREWAKMQRRIYSLLIPGEPKEAAITEILAELDRVGDYFKTIALGRLYHYFGTVGDRVRTVECARMSIEIGERTGMMMVATMAYGILARFTIAEGADSAAEAVRLTRRFFRLCEGNGMYEYFRMRKAYDPVLAFAHMQGIEPEITARLMEFCGYRPARVAVETLGGFAVYALADGRAPIKLRTKKERELLAFLLDVGERGATKEQIAEALFNETVSEDVKRLIGVNLAQLKRDFADAGIENVVICSDKHYHVSRNKLHADIDELHEAAHAFRRTGSIQAARKIILLYKGEYLAEFEALWAIGRRLEMALIHEEALQQLTAIAVQP